MKLNKKELQERDRIAERYSRKILTTFLQKETKKDRISIHWAYATLWTSLCDTVGNVFRRARKSLRVGYFADQSRKLRNGKTL